MSDLNSESDDKNQSIIEKQIGASDLIESFYALNQSNQ